MGKQLSIAPPMVAWVLTILGVQAPLLTGALSTATAVINALPKNRKNLAVFVRRAISVFDAQCAAEARGVGDADQEAVHTRLGELLGAPPDRDLLLAAALLGKEQFLDVVGAGLALYDGLDDNAAGYLKALVTGVHGLVLQFVQSDDEFRAAGTRAFGVLQERIGELESQINARPTIDQVRSIIEEWKSRPLIVGARPALVPGFVARDEMMLLRSALAADGVATVCALEGMRGVGKSQLASAFAQECETAGWAFVGWVTASSREQAVSELAAAARFAGLPDYEDPREAAAAFVVWLNGGGPDDRLLVFDDVVTIEDLLDLVPRGAGMRVIVSTNSRSSSAGTAVEVGVFTSDQAIGYLEHATGLADRRTAGELSVDLGCLPVAVAQAAATINLLHVSYGEYRVLLEQRDLDESVRRPPCDPYPHKVGTALRLAYDTCLESLEASDSELGRVAAWALGALSYLAESGVPRSWLHQLVEDRLVAAVAVGELLRSSILSSSDDGAVVAIHRLQAQVIREDIAATENTLSMAHAALAVLAAADLESPDFWGARLQCEFLIRQLVAIKDQPHSRVLTELPELLHLAVWAMYQTNGLGNPYLAMDLADYGAIFDRVLGPDNREAVVFRNNLARAHELAGQIEFAIPLYEQTLQDRERIFGPGDPQTVTSRNNLGGAYLAIGDLDRAIPLLEEALRGRELLLESDDPLIYQSRINLAWAYSLAAKHDQAIALSESNVPDAERVFGADHRETARARKGLGVSYMLAGDAAQAAPMLERALAGHEADLGAEHLETLAVRSSLAAVLALLGKLDRAISLAKQTLDASERVLGPDHPNTLDSLRNLARYHAEAGHLVLARSLYLRLLADSQRVFGTDDSKTTGARRGLAEVYLGADNPVRALPLLERCLTDEERLLGTDHPDTLATRRQLAIAYQRAGQGKRAIPMLEQSLLESERQLGRRHPDVLEVRHRLATEYAASGDLGQALSMLEQSLLDLEATFGADHALTVGAREDLMAALALRAADQRDGHDD